MARLVITMPTCEPSDDELSSGASAAVSPAAVPARAGRRDPLAAPSGGLRRGHPAGADPGHVPQLQPAGQQSRDGDPGPDHEHAQQGERGQRPGG